jgi:hypothetical protein
MKTLIQLFILAVAAMVSAFRGLRLAANTYDAAVETHESSVTRTNDAAIATRHLLWKKGAADGTVALNGAADIPLGTIDNIESGTGERQSVLLLGKGATKKMIASEAITAGEQVFAAASGKVQDLPASAGTYYCVGTALTAGSTDEVIEVSDCVPFAVVVPA